MMRQVGLLSLVLLVQQAFGYQPTSRRDLFKVGTAAAFALASQPANAVLSSKYCAAGVGEGCADLSEGNELIKSLQEKSAANKEKNMQQAREAYYMKNYPDWFAAVGKAMVKKPDGTFIVVSEAELDKLKKQNKVSLEIPKAMGGQVTDMTQKPVLVLKE